MNETPFSVLPTRSGQLKFFTGDDPIGRSLREFGEWAGLELTLLSHFVTSGDTVVDVGANIGTHTIEFAHRVGPSGRVVAFEPQPMVLALLTENVMEARANNVTIIGKAVGDATGETAVDALPAGLHANYGAARVSGAGTIPVALVSLDSIGLEACGLIKIDAEGQGGNVLAGAVDMIARFRPIIFIECNDVNDAAEITRSEPLLSYDLYFIRCPAFNFHNFLHNPVNTFGMATETSVLAIPKGSEIGLPDVDQVLIEPIHNLDDLASRVLSAPRFGDQTPFDRVSTHLELTRLSEELDRARLREMNLQRQVAMLRSQPTTSSADRLIARLRATPLWPLLAPLRAIVRRYLERSRV